LEDLVDELSTAFGSVVDDLGHFFKTHRFTFWMNAFSTMKASCGAASRCTFAFGIDAQLSYFIFGRT